MAVSIHGPVEVVIRVEDAALLLTEVRDIDVVAVEKLQDRVDDMALEHPKRSLFVGHVDVVCLGEVRCILTDAVAGAVVEPAIALDSAGDPGQTSTVSYLPQPVTNEFARGGEEVMGEGANPRQLPSWRGLAGAYVVATKRPRTTDAAAVRRSSPL